MAVTPHIRPMTAADYPRMVDLWADTPGVGLTDGDTEAGIAAFLARNPDFSQVCEVEGRIVGTILCGHDGRRGYIYHLAVAPEYRGRGLAREMVSRCLAGLKELGLPKCYLMVFTGNEPGNDFWTRAGWTRREDFNVYQVNLLNGWN